MTPVIDPSLCDRCGGCISVCPYEVFQFSNNTIIISSPQDCIECLSCIKECHKKAIFMGD
ncbi:MAG: ferredoxin family protein [Syntrophorhabdaceae bacterium]|nr:ferredoxin family protein [Syntrophorhabdaceae bacterium]